MPSESKVVVYTSLLGKISCCLFDDAMDIVICIKSIMHSVADLRGT